MSRQGSPLRQIICSVCGRQTHTQLKCRDICRPCHQAEPSSVCSRCGLLKHQVSQETGLCPRCTKILERPFATCSRCSKTKAIYNQEDWLCHSCHRTLCYLQRSKVKQNKVKCSVCGEMRASALLSQAICAACWREKQYGHQPCRQCGQLKVFFNKSERLCKQCDKNRRASKVLRDYWMGFTTPYPYNKVLFDLLATTINWQSVKDQTNRRFRIFGCFLQNYQLPQPLTWEAIESVLPKLGPTNRNNPKQIRACLLELGHLLTSLGQLESRETYVLRRYALLPIKKAPEHLQGLLHCYTTWLWEQKTTPANIRDHLEVLAMFWSWSVRRGIKSPYEVQPTLVNDYLLTLCWQWQCSLCQEVTEFSPRQLKPSKVCTYCGAVHSLNQVKRLAQNTLRQHRAKLIVFFDWAVNNRMVIINPVQRQVAAPSPTIRHYPPEVIRQLCEYVVSNNADPVEAIVLYLIIFHALSVWELRHAQIPIVIPMREDIPPLLLAQAYYLIVPKPEPSRGNRSPGRPSIRLDFPLAAVAWLKPLLESFEWQRQQMQPNPNNQYLLLSTMSARHDMPVGHYYPFEIVRRASLKVLGAACNPSTLRKTAGVMFADRAGGGVLRWMGWEEHQAFGYNWIPREVVYPRLINDSQVSASPKAVESIDFPST